MRNTRRFGKGVPGLGLLCILLSLIVTFLLLELVFRVLNIQVSGATSSYSDEFYRSMIVTEHPFYPKYSGPVISGYFYRYKPGACFATIYPDNKRGYFDSQNRIVYQMNSHGFRGPEFPPKGPGVRRILAIGDSFTFGEGVWVDDTYPKMIETTLRKRGLLYEVFNLGINGYDTRDELVLLSMTIQKYEPDIILCGFVLNDVSHYEFDELSGDLSRDWPLSNTPFLSVNFFSQRFRTSYNSRRTIARYQELYGSDKYWGELAGHIRGVRDLADKNGARLLVLLFPDLSALEEKEYVFRSIHEKLGALFDRLEIPWLDLSETYKRYGPAKLRVHKVDGHPNEIAHRIAAHEAVGLIGRLGIMTGTENAVHD